MLSGLKGVQGNIEDIYFSNHSFSAVSRALRKHRAVLLAGDNGSITIYRDDVGNYRCEFDRYMVEKSHEIYKTKTAIKSWLSLWMPQLQRG